MKTLVHRIIVVVFIVLLNSCGGAIGNIQQYDFAVSKPELEKVINNVYERYPDIRIPPNTIYGLEGTGYNYDFREVVIQERGVKYVLSFAYLDDSIGWKRYKTSTISLISGAKYGELLKLPKDISWFNKRKYAKLFEDHFIKKIQQGVVSQFKDSS